MVFFSLKDTILPDNIVRFLNAFVVALSVAAFGFKVQIIKSKERPI